MLKDGVDWRWASLASWAMAVISFVATVLFFAIGYRIALWLTLHAIMVVASLLLAFRFRCGSCDKSIFARELTSGNPITGEPVIVRRFFPESTCSQCRTRLD